MKKEKIDLVLALAVNTYESERLDELNECVPENGSKF